MVFARTLSNFRPEVHKHERVELRRIVALLIAIASRLHFKLYILPYRSRCIVVFKMASQAEEKADNRQSSGSTSELEQAEDLETAESLKAVCIVQHHCCCCKTNLFLSKSPEKQISPVEDEEQSIGRPKSRRSLSLHLTKSHKSSKKENIQKEIYPVTNIEDGLVGWEGQDDPLHPRNYPDSRKWLILAMVSGITFLR